MYACWQRALGCNSIYTSLHPELAAYIASDNHEMQGIDGHDQVMAIESLI